MATRTQRHIHLDLTVEDDGEKAPLKTWTVSEWGLMPEIVTALKRGLGGKLQKHVMKTPGGVAVFENFKYMVKFADDETNSAFDYYDDLKVMLGQTVFLVDNKHCDDGEDHTPFVRQMFFSQMGGLEKFIADLSRFYVAIDLTDDNTV